MPAMPKRLRMKMLIAMNARAGFGTRVLKSALPESRLVVEFPAEGFRANLTFQPQRPAGEETRRAAG